MRAGKTQLARSVKTTALGSTMTAVNTAVTATLRHNPGSALIRPRSSRRNRRTPTARKRRKIQSPAK